MGDEEISGFNLPMYFAFSTQQLYKNQSIA